MTEIRCITKNGQVRKWRRFVAGDKFGDWLILGDRRHSRPGGQAEWLCRCLDEFCGGTEKWVQLGGLVNGRTQRCFKCGTVRRGMRQRVVHVITHKNKMTANYWAKIISGARRRGYEVSITREEADALFTGRCALTGWPISLRDDGAGVGPGSGRQGAITASLDRIDSSKGYMPGNIQWVHKYINISKMAHSQEDFVRMCQAVADHMSIEPKEMAAFPEKKAA